MTETSNLRYRMEIYWGVCHFSWSMSDGMSYKGLEKSTRVISN